MFTVCSIGMLLPRLCRRHGRRNMPMAVVLAVADLYAIVIAVVVVVVFTFLVVVVCSISL